MAYHSTYGPGPVCPEEYFPQFPSHGRGGNRITNKITTKVTNTTIVNAPVTNHFSPTTVINNGGGGGYAPSSSGGGDTGGLVAIGAIGAVVLVISVVNAILAALTTIVLVGGGVAVAAIAGAVAVKMAQIRSEERMALAARADYLAREQVRAAIVPAPGRAIESSGRREIGPGSTR